MNLKMKTTILKKRRTKKKLRSQSRREVAKLIFTMMTIRKRSQRSKESRDQPLMMR
jgi:hypothetical protein